MTTVMVKTDAERYNLEATAVWIGPDLLVYIWGGEAPHIGAVAMAQPRPSLADPSVTSSTASVFTYVGHKEDLLAKQTAEALSAALKAKVVVTAGIHWDGLDQAGIETVVANSKALLGLLLERLEK
jgi:hypothetical protein